MIGQVTIGKSFGGIVRYVMNKRKAEVLDEFGIRSQNSITATEDFNHIRALKPKIKNAVWHTSISFAYDDKLTNRQMISIGRDYLEKIGLKGHQYLMVRHHDTKHEHIHIVSNRIGLDSNLASDKWCKNRTARICDLLEEKYRLTVAKNQGKSNLIINDNNPAKKQVKEKIRLAVSSALDHGISDFDKLSQSLKDERIEIHFHKQKTGRINGVAFRSDNLSIKGSSIDRSFSFRNLAKRLSQNNNYDKDRDHDKRRKN